MNTLLSTKSARTGPGQYSPWAYRYLILNFARRDLKARFKGTVLGWLWALAVPITTVIIYTVVFGLVFRATPPPMGNGDTGHYAVWLLVAIVPWAFFLNSVNMGPVALLGNGPLLQKVYIPAYVPTLASTVAVLVQSAIELGVVIVVLLFFANVSWTYLLLPFWIVLFVVFTACLATALAILNVYARDLSQLVAVVLQLMFFVTPILYPPDLIPEQWNGIPVAAIFDANPLAAYIGAVRDLLYGLTVPSVGVWLTMLGWAVASVVGCVLVYRRWGLDVSESI
jgi:ABC-type polysaccharide/polyol phosphate export permease